MNHITLRRKGDDLMSRTNRMYEFYTEEELQKYWKFLHVNDYSIEDGFRFLDYQTRWNYIISPIDPKIDDYITAYHNSHFKGEISPNYHPKDETHTQD